MAGDRPGRKPKLTPELRKRLLLLLEAGVPRELACPAVGIASRTLRIWMDRAKREEQFAKLHDEIEIAEAEGQVNMMLKVRKDRSWQSAAFLLERVRRDIFHLGTPQGATVNAPLTVTIQRTTSPMEPPEDGRG